MGLSVKPVRLGVSVAHQDNAQEGHDSPKDESCWEHAGIAEGPASKLIAVVTASLLLIASMTKGIPTSLVQLNAASIIAFGIVKEGWKPIMSRSTLKKLFVVWIIAPLFALTLSFSLTVLAAKLGMIQVV